MRSEDAAGKVRAASLTVVPMEGLGGWAWVMPVFSACGQGFAPLSQLVP